MADDLPLASHLMTTNRHFLHFHHGSGSGSGQVNNDFASQKPKTGSFGLSLRRQDMLGTGNTP